MWMPYTSALKMGCSIARKRPIFICYWSLLVASVAIRTRMLGVGGVRLWVMSEQFAARLVHVCFYTNRANWRPYFLMTSNGKACCKSLLLIKRYGSSRVYLPCCIRFFNAASLWRGFSQLTMQNVFSLIFCILVNYCKMLPVSYPEKKNY